MHSLLCALLCAASLGCGDDADFRFRTDPVSEYTRSDRMGMPGVSTVLVTEHARYNDGDPSDDATLTYAAEFIGNLEALHTALDDDLAAVPVTPCSMAPSDPMDASSLPGCLAQEVAPGLPVVSLVVPDTITLDTSAPAGFPNGRLLTDPVIDVTLAVILLDLETHGATDLVGTNPAANDMAFSDTFPYLAPAH